MVAAATDGACSGNPGPGGWGALLRFEDGSVEEFGGHDPSTTNNRMELQAALELLKRLKDLPRHPDLTLRTDSKYLIDGLGSWMQGWKRRGWKTAAGKPVLNQDLWLALDQARLRDVPLTYVKGHSGDPDNDASIASPSRTPVVWVLICRKPLTTLMSRRQPRCGTCSPGLNWLTGLPQGASRSSSLSLLSWWSNPCVSWSSARNHGSGGTGWWSLSRDSDGVCNAARQDQENLDQLNGLITVSRIEHQRRFLPALAGSGAGPG